MILVYRLLYFSFYSIFYPWIKKIVVGIPEDIVQQISTQSQIRLVERYQKMEQALYSDYKKEDALGAGMPISDILSCDHVKEYTRSLHGSRTVWDAHVVMTLALTRAMMRVHCGTLKK
jgi:hypothetical protein